ncbi:MAG: VWA domain-containing protein [Candidatus Ratteibacteria bacterium]|nr:VWA domain-containing protein [Candidatus Ratteibacteria bacterium]
MIKKLLNILYIIIFLLYSNSSLTEEKKTNNLIIIVDSSRSMLQLTRDGKEKLWSAKAALNKLIDKLPSDTNVGLMVFGHRQKNKCDDIEMVLPVAPLADPTIIKGKLNTLKPTGVTPLTASLDRASEHLKKFKGKSTILLITDGKETCGGNPVELVSNMSDKQGLIIIVDVVGLNVTAIERKQLEAIAKAGGGNYYSANTSHELSEAVSEVAEERVIAIEVDINTNFSEETEKQTKTLMDKDLGTLLINYSHILNSIYIYDKDTNQRVDGKAIWIHLENQYSTNLEPGLYMIELQSVSEKETIKIDNIRIKPNKKTTINVD